MANQNDKVIVITGASSGIGEAAALLLAEQGNQIVLAARREDKLKEIVNKIKSQNGEAIYQVTDVTQIEEVEQLAKLAQDEFGSIDVWINNAGLMPHSEFIKKRIDDWNQMIDVNIKGVLNGIAAGLPYMREQQSGQYINISSVAGHLTHPGGGVYSGTKYAVRAISEALRQEEAQAQSNIRVTIVSPGAIDTELPNSVTDDENKQGIDQMYDAFAVSPERIAKTIAFAINMDEDTAVNEFIVRPTAQQV